MVGTRSPLREAATRRPPLRFDVRILDTVAGEDRVLLPSNSTINLLALSPTGRQVAVATGRRDGAGLRGLDLDSGAARVIVRRCCASRGRLGARTPVS